MLIKYDGVTHSEIYLKKEEHNNLIIWKVR